MNKLWIKETCQQTAWEFFKIVILMESWDVLPNKIYEEMQRVSENLNRIMSDFKSENNLMTVDEANKPYEDAGQRKLSL